MKRQTAANTTFLALVKRDFNALVYANVLRLVNAGDNQGALQCVEEMFNAASRERVMRRYKDALDVDAAKSASNTEAQ